MNSLKSLFLLDENITYLNHGSFGACPKPIFNDFIKWQYQLEKNPIQFLDIDLQKNIYNSQVALGEFINCSPDDIVFFQNPTTAINEVIRNLNLKPNDEILSSNHEYGAMDKAWEFISKKTGAKYKKVKLPYPIYSDDEFSTYFEKCITENTKIIFISHITSATGLVFPIKNIIDLARKKNIISIIDGAHVPGQIPLKINELNPDYYTGTCHKWLLCPKGTSFLFVNKKYQNSINPLIISWGYNNERVFHTKFQDEHLWQGTRDVSPFLTIPQAIDFRMTYDWGLVSEKCRNRIRLLSVELKDKFNLEFAFKENPEKWLAQMLSFQLPNPPSDIERIKSLLSKQNITIPVFEWENKLFIRISLNGYNSENDIQKLIDLLPIIIKY